MENNKALLVGALILAIIVLGFIPWGSGNFWTWCGGMIGYTYGYRSMMGYNYGYRGMMGSSGVGPVVMIAIVALIIWLIVTLVQKATPQKK